MSTTARFALLFIISVKLFGKGSCQTFCDDCECAPSSVSPIVVQCTGTENLTSFPENISNTISALYVVNLPITHLETKDLEGLTSLTNLFIIDNKQLTTLEDGSFGDLSNLVILSLRNNSLSTLSTSSLTGLQGLQEINVEHNMITVLPDNICTPLPSLETLKMTQNSLTMVRSDVFKGCSEISYLDLSNNEITTIAEDAFQNLTSLSRLQINGNNLTTFYSAWIVNKSSSFNLVIDNTPFICTVQLKTEYDTMLQSHPQIIGCDVLEKFCPKCENFGGKALINITIQELNSTTTGPAATTVHPVTTSSDQAVATMNSNTANTKAGTLATAKATMSDIATAKATISYTSTKATAEVTNLNEANATTAEVMNGTRINEATTHDASKVTTAKSSSVAATSGALRIQWLTHLTFGLLTMLTIIVSVPV